jgi:hypothetical protein
MDRVIVCGSNELADGIRAALFTVLFAGLPLGLLGRWLARILTRTSTVTTAGAASAPGAPMNDALHTLARFALVILTLNACLIIAPTTFIVIALIVEPGAWPLAFFAALFLAATATADARGLNAWVDVLNRTAETRTLSLAR